MVKIKLQLETEHSKRQILVILNYIRANQKRFNELRQFALVVFVIVVILCVHLPE